MNESSTRRCPLCCEPVHADAKKCPHCQCFLNKWLFIANHPLLAVLPMFIVLAIGGSLLTKIFDKGESFEPHRAQVHIEKSEMQFGELKGSPTVAVVGSIRNEGSITWKTVTLEVQYFNKEHKLIDTKQSKQWSDEVTLPAGGAAAFKISQPREFDSSEYVSYDIRVVDAHDRRGFLQ